MYKSVATFTPTLFSWLQAGPPQLEGTKQRPFVRKKSGKASRWQGSYTSSTTFFVRFPLFFLPHPSLSLSFFLAFSDLSRVPSLLRMWAGQRLLLLSEKNGTNHD